MSWFIQSRRHRWMLAHHDEVIIITECLHNVGQEITFEKEGGYRGTFVAERVVSDADEKVQVFLYDEDWGKQKRVPGAKHKRRPPVWIDGKVRHKVVKRLCRQLELPEHVGAATMSNSEAGADKIGIGDLNVNSRNITAMIEQRDRKPHNNGGLGLKNQDFPDGPLERLAYDYDNEDYDGWWFLQSGIANHWVFAFSWQKDLMASYAKTKKIKDKQDDEIEVKRNGAEVQNVETWQHTVYTSPPEGQPGTIGILLLGYQATIDGGAYWYDLNPNSQSLSNAEARSWVQRRVLRFKLPEIDPPPIEYGRYFYRERNGDLALYKPPEKPRAKAEAKTEDVKMHDQTPEKAVHQQGRNGGQRRAEQTDGVEEGAFRGRVVFM